MTKGKNATRAGLAYSLGNILIKGLTFLTMPLFTRILTKAEFGIFNTYMSYEAIIAIFINLGLYATIKNANIDYHDKINTYIANCVKLMFFPLMTLIVVFSIFHKQFENWFELPYYLIIVLVFHSFSSAMLQVNNAKLSLNYRYWTYLGFAFFNTIFNIGGSLLLIHLLPGQRVYGRILGAAIPLILISIYVCVSCLYRQPLKIDKEMSKFGLKLGFPLIFHYLSQTISSQADRIVIKKLVGDEATGIYSFSYLIAQILQVIYYSTDSSWSVWFYHQMQAQNYQEIRKKSRLYIILITFIAFSMIVGSEEVIWLMGEEGYQEGINLMLPLILGIYLLFLYTLPAGIEYYYKETKFISMMTAISAVFNIVTNIIFIKIYGYVAASYTTFFSYLILFVSHWIIAHWVLKKHSKVKAIFNILDFVLPFTILTVLGVGAMYLNDYIFIKYGCYIVISLLLFFIFRRDIIDTLKSIFNKA